MNSIALCGVPYAGKTTVAREFAKQGWVHIDFGGVLRKYAARALCVAGIYMTPAMLAEEKATYRAFLQEFGRAIGFGDRNATEYVMEALGMWAVEGGVIFDCVRTPQQWLVLKRLGFTLVRVVVTPEVQQQRAKRLGVKEEDFLSVLADPLEAGLPGFPAIEIDGSKDVASMIAQLKESYAYKG